MRMARDQAVEELVVVAAAQTMRHRAALAPVPVRVGKEG